MNMNSQRKHHRGAALVTGLIMLLIVSLLGFAAIRSNTLELRIASNLEAKHASFQQAQAALDYLRDVLDHPERHPEIRDNPLGVPDQGGYTRCSTNLTSGFSPCGNPWNHCDDTVLGSPMTTDNALQLTYRMTAPCPSDLESSQDKLECMYFEARSCYDGSASGGAATELRAGIVRVKLK